MKWSRNAGPNLRAVAVCDLYFRNFTFFSIVECNVSNEL